LKFDYFSKLNSKLTYSPNKATGTALRLTHSGEATSSEAAAIYTNSPMDSCDSLSASSGLPSGLPCATNLPDHPNPLLLPPTTCHFSADVAITELQCAVKKRDDEVERLSTTVKRLEENYRLLLGEVASLKASTNSQKEGIKNANHVRTPSYSPGESVAYALMNSNDKFLPLFETYFQKQLPDVLLQPYVQNKEFSVILAIVILIGPRSVTAQEKTDFFSQFSKKSEVILVHVHYTAYPDKIPKVPLDSELDTYTLVYYDYGLLQCDLNNVLFARLQKRFLQGKRSGFKT